MCVDGDCHWLCSSLLVLRISRYLKGKKKNQGAGERVSILRKPASDHRMGRGLHWPQLRGSMVWAISNVSQVPEAVTSGIERESRKLCI